MCNLQFYANAYLYQKSSVETPMICKWLVVSTLGLLIQIKLFNEELSPFITSIRNVKTYYSHHLGQLNKNRNVSTLDFLTQIKLLLQHYSFKNLIWKQTYHRSVYSLINDIIFQFWSSVYFH